MCECGYVILLAVNYLWIMKDMLIICCEVIWSSNWVNKWLKKMSILFLRIYFDIIDWILKMAENKRIWNQEWGNIDAW